MRRDNKYILLIWMLTLMVIFFPMHVALSAIDLHDYQTEHCQTDISGKLDHASMVHPDTYKSNCYQHDGSCQDSCSSCTQCVSAHAMLSGQILLHQQSPRQFSEPKISLAKGLFRPGKHRPPRLLS